MMILTLSKSDPFLETMADVISKAIRTMKIDTVIDNPRESY